MVFGIALICVMVFTACDNIIDPPGSNTQVESGYGKISISFAGGATARQTARTVFPSIVFDHYVYTFTRAGEETGVVKVPDDDGFFTLKPGIYTVEVKAFVGDEEPYTLAATGVSSEFSVNPGTNDTVVEVFLTGVGAGTQGEFSYTITYPADATVEITLQTWPALGDINLTSNNLTEGNGITGTLVLETGSYLLTVLVSKTGLYAGTNEAVHIYPSLATVYIKNYEDYEFLSKLPGAAVNAPTLNDFTQDSITINPVDPPDNGQTVEYGITEYSINTGYTEPSTWQTELTFSGLSGGVFYLFARSAENDDYTAGTANANLRLPVMIVTTAVHWSNALTTISNGGYGTYEDPLTYTITVFGDVAVPGNTDSYHGYSFGYVQYIEVTLRGSGMLSLSSYGSLLWLISNQTLIIDDENLTLHAHNNNHFVIDGSHGNSYFVLVDGGTLELKAGTIRGSTISGVQIENYGTFTMSGGTISDNADSGVSAGNFSSSNNTFTMTGGTISGNGDTAATTYGGGVCLYYSTFTMTGGTISGNAAVGGGGVCINYGNFTMSGGTISGNTTGFYGGGGVLVSLAGTFTMTGGIVYGSDADPTLANTTVGSGAALHVFDFEDDIYDGTAQYGDGSNILPHTDGQSSYTDNTIKGDSVDGAAVDAPAGTSSVTGTSITINPVAAPGNGQTIEYAINTTNSPPSSGWQSGTTFSALTSGTTYYIFARSAPTADYRAGAASASLQVATSFPLSTDTWADGSGSITSNTGGILYSFDVVSGTTYYVWWNDSKEGNSTKTLDVTVSAAYSDGSTIFTDKDSGWTSPQSFTADRDGTVNIWVTSYNGGGYTGTFAIAYSTINSAKPSYTVTFDANGGSGTVSTQSVTPGESITLPDGSGLSRDGYAFGGWTTDASGGTTYSAGASYTPTGNVTMYAKWNYVVTFSANNGSGTPSAAQTVTPGSSITLPSSGGLSRNGYVFYGWNTYSSGTGTNYNVGTAYTPTSNVTLYARWIPIISNVSDIASYLSSAPEGSTPSNPVFLYMAVSLTQSNWEAILSAIQNQDPIKFIALNLSACTHGGSTSGNGLRSDGTFSPGTANSSSSGVRYIRSLVLPNSATEIVSGINSNYTYLQTVSGSGITSIGNEAFRGCTSLTNVSFPEALSIGISAFRGCTGLTTISASFSNVTFIGGAAFRDCTGLTTISATSFPNVTIIDISAFSGCTNLTTASFPNVTDIYCGVNYDNYLGPFQDCTNLISVSFPKVTSIPGGNFGSIGGSAGVFRNCTSLSSVSIPNATDIGSYAFLGCTSLTNVSFPNATSIGQGAFYNSGLTNISFLKVTNIGGSAFYGCTNLSNVTLNLVTSIGGDAFASTGNRALTITMGWVVPTVGSGMFSGVSSAKNVTVRIPTGATGYDTTWQNNFKGGNSNINLTMQTYTP